MTFSEYALGLFPYISYGKKKGDYFTELIGNFLQDAVIDSCEIIQRPYDTRYRYIKGSPINTKDAQFIYDHRDLKKYSSWIEERMGDTDSYDKIEGWLNEKGITADFVPDACAELLEAVILRIINPPVTSESDVQLPPEVEAAVLEAEVGGAELSQADNDLLQAFHADYDKIIKLCIGEGYAEVWLAGNISKQINDLYNKKWSFESIKFQNILLRASVIETLGLLQQLFDILDPNTKGTTITAFQPSVRAIRLKLRNQYVKLHPNEYAGVFPYEAFVPDWDDGEE